MPIAATQVTKRMVVAPLMSPRDLGIVERAASVQRRSSAALEARLALVEERAAAFGVILAVKAR
ncbi:MAG TPA: hypothetical protein VJ045_02545, partial [Hyphomicrobiaceae bacterium]|nr:hypothetical protein [Hyphomicrobiaceae bacterium]